MKFLKTDEGGKANGIRLKNEEDPPRYHAKKQTKGQGSGDKDVAAF